VYTKDVNVAMRALNELDNGITYINAPTIGAEAHLPFGGVKQTGNGHREGGWQVYEFYSRPKSATSISRACCSGRRSTTIWGRRIERRGGRMAGRRANEGTGGREQSQRYYIDRRVVVVIGAQ